MLSSRQSTFANGTGTILGFGSVAMPNHMQACPGMQKGAAFHCPATHLRRQGAFVVVREMLGCLEVNVAALAKGGVGHCHIAKLSDQVLILVHVPEFWKGPGLAWQRNRSIMEPAARTSQSLCV